MKCIHPFLLNAATLIQAFKYYSTENSENKAIFPKQKSPTKVTATPIDNGSFQNWNYRISIIFMSTSLCLVIALNI